MKKIIRLTLFVSLIILTNACRVRTTINYVPNKETAIRIAEAIWLPIYGEEIYDQKPYIVTLLDNIWIVEGSLPEEEEWRGGCAYIEIQKRDCKILKVQHFR